MASPETKCVPTLQECVHEKKAPTIETPEQSKNKLKWFIKQIIKSWGMDIGNPPVNEIQLIKNMSHNSIAYYKTKTWIIIYSKWSRWENYARWSKMEVWRFDKIFSTGQTGLWYKIHGELTDEKLTFSEPNIVFDYTTHYSTIVQQLNAIIEWRDRELSSNFGKTNNNVPFDITQWWISKTIWLDIWTESWKSE